jgi:hypothetical protein
VHFSGYIIKTLFTQIPPYLFESLAVNGFTASFAERGKLSALCMIASSQTGDMRNLFLRGESRAASSARGQGE